MKKPFYKRRIIVFSLLLLALIIISDIILIVFTHGGNRSLTVENLNSSPSVSPSSISNAGASNNHNSITVLSINMAHGRGNGRNQIVQPTPAIQKNVGTIGALIARENPDLVALQEADAPSWWSGNFSHVKTAGHLGKMNFMVQGKNVDGFGLAYGTSLLAKPKLTNAYQITFERNIPTFSKGFVVASCEWPDDPSFLFDVVSVHLDFANPQVRKKQLQKLQGIVEERNRPVILMGDFNAGFSQKSFSLFVQELELSTWKKNDTTLITFPRLKSRIDWVFVSKEFRIQQQSILEDIISDHRIVKANITRVN